MELNLDLPTDLVPPSYVDPRVLVLYSLPKIGKTPTVAQLPKCLVVDIEGGTDYIAATKVKVIGLKPPVNETPEQKQARFTGVLMNGAIVKPYYMTEVISALRKKNPYTFIAIDTVTKLEEMCEKDATMMYMNSPVGINFNRYSMQDQNNSKGSLIAGTLKPENQWKSVLTLANGGGYFWLRESFVKWIKYFQDITPHLILLGHVKTTQLNKEGREVDAKDLDLTGRIKGITTALIADAVGYMYRQGNKNLISFKPSDEVMAGSRIAHLEGKQIVISEKLESGEIKTYWGNIFKQLAK